MIKAVHAYPIPCTYSLSVIDVDDDPALLEKYDELVPVLCASVAGGPEYGLCHYFLDHEALRKFLLQVGCEEARAEVNNSPLD